MKIFSILFTLLVIASIAFSITNVNVDAPFEGESTVALIMIMAALCALVLVYILKASKRIEKKSKGKR